MMRLVPLFLSVGVAACSAESDSSAPADKRVAHGSVEHGRALFSAVGCGACHRVSSLPGARGVVGPSLDLFGRRALIAGEYPNRPGILADWVRDAPRLEPETAMPSMPLDEAQARDVAAYLYTLR
jgi:mono/diheme cytochrome c family protein